MSNHTTDEQYLGAQVRSPRQNEKQNEEEAVVAPGQRLSGAPILFRRDRHERLRAPGGSAASCRGGRRCRKGREVDKHKGYYSKLLFSLFVTSILIATTVVIARNRARIGVKIGTSAKLRLAELKCPLFSNSSRTTVSFQGGERRLAAGGTPPDNRDADEDLEVACTTALGLSLVDGDRTVTPVVPSGDLGGDLRLVQDTSVGDILDSLEPILKKSREDVVILLDDLLDLNPELSVVELVAHLRGFDGDVSALQNYLLESSQARSLKEREKERCAHRRLGFHALPEAARLDVAEKLGMREAAAPAFSVESEQLGDPLTVLNVKADGNCFFRAVSIILTGSQRQHWRVRQSLVQWMTDHFYFTEWGEMLLSTEDLRRQETLERELDQAKNSFVHIPYKRTAVQRLSREQLLEARISRMGHLTLGTFATDVEIQAMAQMLGINICTYVPYEVQSARPEASNGVWEVRSPLAVPDYATRPSIYLYLHGRDHFQVVTQTTRPFHNLLLTRHLRELAAQERERRKQLVPPSHTKEGH